MFSTVAAALACRVGLRIKVPFRLPNSLDLMSKVPSVGTGSVVLDDIAGVIGLDATLALAVEFKGERAYIPKVLSTEPRIAEAIGEEWGAKLCDAFWSTYISFPSSLITEHLVVRMAETGVTKREIARRLKIRQARVFAILKRYRETE